MGKDDIIALDHCVISQGHAAGADRLDCTLQDLAFLEHLIQRDASASLPTGNDHTSKRSNLVVEGIGGLNQSHLTSGIEILGGGDATVTCSDNHYVDITRCVSHFNSFNGVCL